MSNSKTSPNGLVGVAFLPHGTMTLDPFRIDLPSEAITLHNHCISISAHIAALKPDLIFLSTPHGLSLHQAGVVYQPGMLNATASGNCEWRSEWKEWGVKVKVESNIASDLVHFLQNRPKEEEIDRLRVESLVAFAGLSTPLRWGETVPLYFALRNLVHSESNFIDATDPSDPPVVFFSQPRLGLTENDRSSFRIKQRSLLPQLGRDVRSFIDSLPLRSLLIISGDLAHTHPWSKDPSILPTLYTPDPSSFNSFPTSGNKEAPIFDEIVRRWVTGGTIPNTTTDTDQKINSWQLEESIIANEAGQVEEKGISCGYSGLLTLQGILDGETIVWQTETEKQQHHSFNCWKLSDFLLTCPSYYGMMSAMFTRKLGA